MTRAHVAVVFKSAAGSAADHKLKMLVQELGKLGLQVSLLPTSAAPDSATDLASAAALARVDCVIAAGGDGTVRQVASGLRNTGVALSAFPVGTGNVFAHHMRSSPGKLQTFLQFVQAYAAMIANTPAQPMDLIGFACRDLAGVSQHGVAVVGIGIGEVSDALVNTSSRMKRAFGSRAYMANIGWAGLRFKHLPVVLTTPNSSCAERLVGACTFNALPARLSSLSSGASFNDGLIDFVGLRDGKASKLLAAGMNALLGREDRSGQYARLRCAQLTIEADRPMLLNLDGDAGPKTMKVELSALADAVHVISGDCSNREGKLP